MAYPNEKAPREGAPEALAYLPRSRRFLFLAAKGMTT